MATAASGSALKLRFKSPPNYSGRIPDPEWVKHRLFITYLHNGRVVRSQMLKILKVCREFSPSEHQLNSKLEAWNLKVYKKSKLTTENRANTISARIDTIHNLIKNCNGRPSKHFSMRETPATKQTTSLEAFEDVTQVENLGYAEDESPLSDDTTTETSVLVDEHQNLQSTGRASSIQEFISPLDSDLIGPETSIQDPRKKCDLDPDDLLDSVRSIVAWTLVAGDAYGVESSDTLTDVGQLLYACRLFPEASAIFDKSYQQLSTQANVPNMKRIYCRLDTVRAYRSGLRTKTMRDDMEIMLAYMTICLGQTKNLYGEIYAGRTGNSYREAIAHILQDFDGNANWFPSNILTRTDQFSIPPTDNGSTEWILRHGDIVWRCAASHHLSDAKQVLSELQSWIEDLEQESSRIWQILRDCLKVLQRHCADLSLASMLNSATMESDINLHIPNVLGCFFVREYLVNTLFDKLEPIQPLSDRERLTRIVSSKVTIQTCLVLATWITNSESTFMRRPFLDPVAAVIECTRSTLKLSLEQRAQQVLQIHKTT